MSGDEVAARPPRDDLRIPGRPVAWATGLLALVWVVPAWVSLSSAGRDSRGAIISVLALLMLVWVTFRLALHPTPPYSAEGYARRMEQATARSARPVHLLRAAVIGTAGCAVLAVFVGWGVHNEVRIRNEGRPLTVVVLDTQHFSTMRGGSSTLVCFEVVGVAGEQDCVSVNGSSDLRPGDLATAHADTDDANWIVLDAGLPKDLGFLLVLVAAAITLGAVVLMLLPLRTPAPAGVVAP